MRRKLTLRRPKIRWDSSDPDRAPPPLPLNPTSSSPVTRPNTSARIEEAAALITSKARETAASNYTTNSMSVPSSPEKSLIKGHHHKRMQSLKNGNVRDLSNTLERRSPEKSLSTNPPRLSDFREEKSRSPTRSPTDDDREHTPVPVGRDTPPRRPTSNYLNKPILGENTPPPSATMLALQNMRDRDAPLANITNSSTALTRSPQTFDALSSQILSLTTIATNLQREMAQLSRRSKDNATDLVSLKDATNTRDEDIRKSIKDLVSNITTKFLDHPRAEAGRSAQNLNSFLLDSKAHTTPTGRKNGFSLPRIPSPTSFSAALERDMTASPSVVSSDGAASIALLEKVLREMGTRDGQDQILSALSEVKAQSADSKYDPTLSKKLDEVFNFLKDRQSSQALVRASAGGETDASRTGPLAKAARDLSARTDTSNKSLDKPTEFVNEEMMNLLKRVKNSVAEGGGLTNEVKGLVRDLRGEVLGMGREIARKLEQAEASYRNSASNAQGPSSKEIGQIVDDGLSDLREQMELIVRENRRASSGTTKSAVDPQEMYMAVKAALAEYPLRQAEPRDQHGLQKEEILVAVREAWEECKPEIELQNFGLEREEILECLTNGLKTYQPQLPDVREVGASYDEVLEAVNRGLQNFRPPPIDTEANLTREEILMTVRECLESFDFPAAAAPAQPFREPDITRDDVLNAVREGLQTQGSITKEIEFNRDDLFDAIKAGLEGAPTPMGGVGEQVLEQMHGLISEMKVEFQQYSAANGKDTEQVLDAMKDGLEVLRADIESYVDRAADVTGKDEIIETVKNGFRQMQADIQTMPKHNKSRPLDTPELLDAMDKEFEHLRDTISKTLVRSGDSTGKEEILDAIRDIQDRGSHRQSFSADKEEILEAIRDMQDNAPADRSILSESHSNVAAMVKEELEHMRETLATTLIRGVASSTPLDRDEILEAVRDGVAASRDPPRPGSESILSNTSELLDAFQDGVDHIRADMQELMNRSSNIGSSYETLDALRDGVAGIREDIEKLQATQHETSDATNSRGREVIVADEQTNLLHTEIEALKIMVGQLLIKVEALDEIHPISVPQMPAEGSVSKDDLAELAATIRAVQERVTEGFNNSARTPSPSEKGATKEDTEAIENLLRNAKARIEELDPEGVAKQEHVESLEAILLEIKDLVTSSAAEAIPKADFSLFEIMLKEVSAGVEELQNKANASTENEEVKDTLTKADIQAVETLCLDTKTQIGELVLPDVETLPTRDDVAAIKDTIKGFQEQIEVESQMTAEAFEARKTEHGGLASKIEETKVLLGDLRDELKAKLDGSEEGLADLGRLLESHHEGMATYATAESIKEMLELVSKGFDSTHEKHDATKLEVEERDAAISVKHDETRAALAKELADKLDERFNEIMTKYDDSQLAADAKFSALEADRGEHHEAVTGTRAVAEEVKTLLDTLGTTITEACDRIGDDSKTIFNRVEEFPGKLDELNEENKTQHAMTREDMSKAIAGLERVEGTLGEHQPSILEAVREVLGIVGQHYEHSQKSAEEIKTGMNGIPSAIPPLLPALPSAPMSPPLPREIPVQQEYDDSQVHDKLNTLIGHATVARESLDKMSKLDDIHSKVVETAQEVSNMVATQTRLMTEHHDSRALEAQEAAVALEKRTAQKEQAEFDIVGLNQEKMALSSEVGRLKLENEELMNQSKRLSMEVAGLEMAVNLRREEMVEMERRAGVLEKRILEGVMDHARGVLLSKNKPSGSAKRKREAEKERDRVLSLKRVPSAASTSTVDTTSTAKGTVTSTTPSVLGSAVSMALKKRERLSSPRASNVGLVKERRILSTSHVQGNSRRSILGETADQQAMMLAPIKTSSPGFVGLKRSQSVKSNPSTYYGGRKASWAGRDSLASSENKENEEVAVLKEEDEDEEGDDGMDTPTDDTSDCGTERRTSYTETVEGSDIYTDSLAYGTGSSLSTDSGARSVSYASTTQGEISGQRGQAEDDEDKEEAVHPRSPDEPEDPSMGAEAEAQTEEAPSQESEADKIMALLGPPSWSTETHDFALDHDQHTQAQSEGGHDPDQQLAIAQAQSFHDIGLDAPPKINTDIVLFGQPSDSGLGSDIPTAALEGVPGHGNGYFGDLRDQDMGV